MSSLAFQNSSYGGDKSAQDVNLSDANRSQKATPIAPQESARAPKKAQGAFRTISEVADELDVPQHVLRFWETKFTQVKPLKRGGGRRYYRPEDVALLKHIHYQLYTEGYTIKGVQKLLKGQGKNQIAAQVAAEEKAAAEPPMQAQAAQSQPAAPQPKAQLEGKIMLSQGQQAQAAQPAKAYDLSESQRSALEDMLTELKALRAMFPEQAA